MPNERDILTGKTDAHVEPFEGGVPIHSDMKDAFILLREKAKVEGIRLKIASGYRSFDAQLRIWNAKAQGKRDLLDKTGKKLDIEKLSAEEVVFAILRWSALPGGSRHHWGTDIDVWDAAAVPEDYQLRLVPEEAAPGGPFAKLNRWLEANMASEGFFRPYERDLGGVSPEWWHLSYAPLAEPYFAGLSLSLLEDAIRAAEMDKKEIVLKRLTFIFQNYVRNICPPKGIA